MPRPKWIGSASTKRATQERFDVEIVNTNPNYHGAEERMMIYCEASRVAHVIWQVNPVGGGGPNMWISQLIPPPYFAYDRGIMGQPQPPQLVNLQLAVGGQHSFYNANWLHHMYFDMDPQQPEWVFRYQSPKTGEITLFRRLHFMQQIQTATLADSIV